MFRAQWWNSGVGGADRQVSTLAAGSVTAKYLPDVRARVIDGSKGRVQIRSGSVEGSERRRRCRLRDRTILGRGRRRASVTRAVQLRVGRRRRGQLGKAGEGSVVEVVGVGLRVPAWMPVAPHHGMRWWI
jgi:hypothetical protein